MTSKRVLIAITGASGQIYAKRLLEKTNSLLEKTDIHFDIIFSDTAKTVWKEETGQDIPAGTLNNHSYYTQCASGSNPADVMIIIPCTMGTIGRIAAGVSDDLICRAADVMLKERKTLIIVPRETPYNLIHLRNMTILTEAGAIIAPASPSFYTHPADINSLVDNFVYRILSLASISEIPQELKWKG